VRWSALVAVVLCLGACSSQQSRIQQHQEKLESLGATTAAVGDAWLGGNLRGRYTVTALEQTFLQVEQERTALASAPEMLLDPRGAALSQQAEQLSRLIATLIHDVRGADGESVRRRLADIPIRPHES
jgi:hypothetical protein